MREQLVTDFDKIISDSNFSKKDIELKRISLDKFIEDGFPTKKKEKKPLYFDTVQEYFLDKETTTPPPSREESPETPVITLPTCLPPEYEVLLQENGIIEEKRPVSAPCFADCPDPSGKKPWLGIAAR